MIGLAEPRLAGMLLDAWPSQPNRALQMERQYVRSASELQLAAVRDNSGA